MIDYPNFKENSITGRYVTAEQLRKIWFDKLKGLEITPIGHSVYNRSIDGITLGFGPKRIYMWSQMHGNESTTTKAVIDLVNFLQIPSILSELILERCTLKIIPILNPDGAKAYTRVNAAGMDLNRDAKQLCQPESKALRDTFQAFDPHFCFNLHDQRTLFSAGNHKKAATVSFLAPSSDAERKVTPVRKIAMGLIVEMNNALQSMIPGQVGRYDDAFNENCVGDTFQMLGKPTILFEAGHYPNDYQRERTREYIFHALSVALEAIALGKSGDFETKDYFNIPENKKLFYDVLVKNPRVINPELESKESVGIRYKEVLKDEKIGFMPEIADIKMLDGYYGHLEYDCHSSSDLKALTSLKEVHSLILSAEKK